MTKGETSVGFAYEVDETRLDDWDVFEWLSDIEEKPLLYTKIARRILGDDQYKALKATMKESGKYTIDEVGTQINEILNAVNASKNS